MAIMFYRISEPYGCFSNFAHYGFNLDGLFWKTSEHYFQAQKFIGTNHVAEIYNLDTPLKAAQYGRRRDIQLRSDWELVKNDVMRTAVLAKFSQNQEIKDVLLSTGEALLVENTTEDYYWGCGTNGNGENWLGRILMETRDILRAKG